MGLLWPLLSLPEQLTVSMSAVKRQSHYTLGWGKKKVGGCCAPAIRSCTSAWTPTCPSVSTRWAAVQLPHFLPRRPSRQVSQKNWCNRELHRQWRSRSISMVQLSPSQTSTSMPWHCGEQINQLLPKNTVNQFYFKKPNTKRNKQNPLNKTAILNMLICNK